jgi:site-specific DNA-methyltransferase (adenine-specific)
MDSLTYRIFEGDALARLREMPDGSVQTCITSPPYYGLRDYGVAGQIGQEETPDEYIARLVAVFREVRRVLRGDGTLWVNIGDSYNNSTPNRDGKNGYADGRENRDKRLGAGGIEGLKPKDLIGIPWMMAFALRADGWRLRQDVIWAKPNPQPESVRDRCTKAHEYIFLLSKSASYYYDHEAIREPATHAGKRLTLGPKSFSKGQAAGAGVTPSGNALAETYDVGETRNKRSVWTVPTVPYPGAHFAAFPPDLIRPCILAGCPEGGTVLDPFTGSGTTGYVALKTGRNFVGIELNPEYVRLAHERIGEARLTLFDVAAA